MKIFAFILSFSTVALPAFANANSVQDKLYASCLASSKNITDQAKNACKCQAEKWASGKIHNPKDPSKTLMIKKGYIDNLITNWNHNIGFKDGAKLQGANAEMAAIALNIGFACTNESGEFKPDNNVDSKATIDSSQQIISANNTDTKAGQSAKIIKKDFEADLKVIGKESEGRVGRAKWDEYADGKQRFKVTVNKKAEEFAAPISIKVNGKAIGKALRETMQASGKEYVFYKFNLQSDEGDTIPIIKEGDIIILNTANGIEIAGIFVPD